jgi:hypothetical protein
MAGPRLRQDRGLHVYDPGPRLLARRRRDRSSPRTRSIQRVTLAQRDALARSHASRSLPRVALAPTRRARSSATRSLQRRAC